MDFRSGHLGTSSVCLCDCSDVSLYMCEGSVQTLVSPVESVNLEPNNFRALKNCCENVLLQENRGKLENGIQWPWNFVVTCVRFIAASKAGVFNSVVNSNVSFAA